MRIRNSSFIFGMSLLALTATLFSGCKDSEKCTEALNTARQAMKDEYLDMALARQWRDHAGKICGQGAELQALDQEILDREAALAQAAAAAAKKAADDGAAALKNAQKVWKSWDKLDEDKQDKKSLAKTNTKAAKLGNGLLPEYAKQVADYNKKQYKARAKKLKAKK